MSETAKLLTRSLRDLVRQPLLSGLALLALAIGIALVTLMFSILEGIFLRVPPHTRLADVYRVSWRNLAAGIENMPVTTAAYLEWRRGAAASLDIAAFMGTSATLNGDGEPADRANGAYATPNLFSLVGAKPILGRTFHPDEESSGAELTVILSDDLWSSRYQRDPAVLGRTLRVDGASRTIVGIMPPGFRFPLNQYLWIPLQLNGEAGQEQNSLQLLVKPKRGISHPTIAARLSALKVPLTPGSLKEQQGAEVVVEPFMKAYTDPQLRKYLEIMLLAAGVVLIISSVNVASVILVRSTSRIKDFAIRRALGARPRDLLSIPAVEAVVLTFLAGILGYLLAELSCRWIAPIVGRHLLSYWVEVTIDPRVLLAAVGISVVISGLAGSFPAWRGLAGGAIGIGEQSAGIVTDGRSGRIHRHLVILQVSLTFGTLVPAALIVTSLTQLEGLSLGFATRGALTAQLSLPPSYDSRKIVDFITAFENRVEKLPGVRQASLGNFVPTEDAWEAEYEVEGSELAAAESMTGSLTTSTTGFFEVFGLRPLYGRDFSSADDLLDVSPAIVTETLARRHFTDPSAIVGHRLRFRGSESWKRVVGVYADTILGTTLPERTSEALIRKSSGRREREAIFLPLQKMPNLWLTLAVSADERLPPRELAAALRRELASVDSDVPMFWIRTMDERIEEILWDYHLFGGLFIVFAAVALLQTAVGIFATIHLGVARRLREMGLRLAMGASPFSIRMLILKECGSLLLRGIAGGSLIAAALVQALQSLVYGADAWSWLLFVLTAGVLAGTGLAAGWSPARRASRVEPALMLRGE